MRAVKHAVLSLIRKPTKAIMILIILFVVYGLVFTGIIIQNSVKSSKEYIRKELGAIVQLKPDYLKAIQDKLSDQDRNAMLSLSPALARTLADDSRVKELYMTSFADAVNAKLESAVKTEEINQEGVFSVTTAENGMEGSFTLVGSNTNIPLEFEDSTLKLTQGRFPDKNDKGKDTLLISEEFANQNNLSVGSQIELTSQINRQTYSFEIIGIFSGSNSFMVDEMRTSLESVFKLSNVKEEDSYISSVSLLLKDPLEVEGYIKQYQSRMPNDYISLYSNDNEYKALTRPLEFVDIIISILIGIVFVAGIIIMIAIVTMFVRDRRFEIGLLLASGEGKIKILFQFIMEILIVSVIAFVLSAGASKITSSYTASWIINNQLTEENIDTGKNIIISGMKEKDELEISDVARDFNVTIDSIVIRNLLAVSLFIVILSASAPLLIILGYKPRQSLQN